QILDGTDRARQFSYDGMNRLTSEVWLDNASAVTPTVADRLTFLYDPAGNQTLAQDYHSLYTYSYDALDPPRVVNGPFGVTLSLSYDAVGNRTLVQDSYGGSVSSSYDAVNRLTRRDVAVGTVTLLRFDLGYTGRSRLSQLVRYQGGGGSPVLTSNFTYDDHDRLMALTHGGVGSYTFLYDAADRVTVEQFNGGLQTISYDDAAQVTADGTSSFSYDATGNRTNTGYQTGPGNQLLNDGTWTFTYRSYAATKGGLAPAATFPDDGRACAARTKPRRTTLWPRSPPTIRLSASTPTRSTPSSPASIASSSAAI